MTIAIRTDTLLTATLLLQYTDGQTDRRSVSTFTLSLLYPQSMSVVSDRELVPAKLQHSSKTRSPPTTHLEYVQHSANNTLGVCSTQRQQHTWRMFNTAPTTHLEYVQHSVNNTATAMIKVPPE